MSTQSFPSFGRWVTSRGKAVYLAVAVVFNVAVHLVAASKSVAEALPRSLSQLIEAHPSLAPIVLHLVAILVFLIVLLAHRRTLLPAPRKDTEDEIKTATDSRRDLYYAFVVLWAAWLFMYVGFTIQEWTGAYKAAFAFVGTLLNNAQSAALFAMAWEMSELTQEGRTPGDSRHNRPLQWVLVALVILFSLVHLLVGFQSEEAQNTFTGIAGIIGGVAIALFAGRLDSKLMSPPKAPLVLLYLYACIQALFPLLFEHPRLELALLAVALTLKTSLFLLVYWLFSSGRIVFYAWEIKKIMQSQATAFEEFHERYFTDKPISQSPLEVQTEPGSVFVAAAMSSLPEKERSKIATVVGEISDHLQTCNLRAMHFTRTRAPYDPAQEARLKSLAAVARAEIVVILYTHNVGSSMLIEAGAALAQRKKIVLIAKYDLDLPFLLRNLPSDSSTTELYRKLDELPALVASRCKHLHGQPLPSP